MYQYSPMGNGAIIATPLFGLPSHLRTPRVYTIRDSMSIDGIHKNSTVYGTIVLYNIHNAILGVKHDKIQD